MKAAVCYEYGQPLVVEDIIIDPPQHGEVKVRIAASAICHSDLHLIHGDFGGKVPVVAGHEASGIVEEIGEGVISVKVGDRVVVSLLRSCGRCEFCLSGSPNNCNGRFPIDSDTRLHTHDGQPIRIGAWVAAFAEYCVVDQSQVVPISEEIAFDKAALLACGVITGVGAVFNTAQVKPGSSVVVIGCGGVGLNSIQAAALVGASPIIAIDLVDTKLEMAKTFGATHTINAAQDGLRDEIRKLTGGLGAEYVFVTVGSPKAIEQGFTLARRHGTIVIVGLPGRVTAALPVNPFVQNEQRILASWMGSTRLSVDVPRLANLYLSGRLKLDELITAHYPLERINDAIATLETGEALRNVIVF